MTIIIALWGADVDGRTGSKFSPKLKSVLQSCEFWQLKYGRWQMHSVCCFGGQTLLPGCTVSSIILKYALRFDEQETELFLCFSQSFETPPPPVSYQPNSVSWPPLTGLHDHTLTHHTRYDSSGRVLSRYRELYLSTHNSHNRHPCRRRDSNPQSQRACGRRPMPWIARSPESVLSESELQRVSWHWQCRTGGWHHWTQAELIVATSIESHEMWVSASQSHSTWCYTLYPARDTAIQLLWVCGHLATQWLSTGKV